MPPDPRPFEPADPAFATRVRESFARQGAMHGKPDAPAA